MVQSPSWEANWFAASQEIPRISRNPKVHYRTHKLLPQSLSLSQSNSEVKNKWRHTSTGPISLHGVESEDFCLFLHRQRIFSRSDIASKDVCVYF